MAKKIKTYYVQLSKKGRNSKKHSLMFGSNDVCVQALSIEGAKLSALKKKNLLLKFKNLNYLKVECGLL